MIYLRNQTHCLRWLEGAWLPWMVQWLVELVWPCLPVGPCLAAMVKFTCDDHSPEEVGHDS